MPREVWDAAAENGHVFQRPYPGFGGTLPAASTLEYRINSGSMIQAINRFRERVE